MRYLLYSSLLFLSVACASDYKGMQQTTLSDACWNLKPTGIEMGWYDASVDVVNKHISGLLVIKTMTDQSKRVVFMNEAGVTFFDFEFRGAAQFKVINVIPMLDKKVVLQALQKDFTLLLALPLQQPREQYQSWKFNNETYLGVINKKERTTFVTDSTCSQFIRIENGSLKKRVVTIEYKRNESNQLSSAHITHHTFSMRIDLKKIERE